MLANLRGTTITQAFAASALVAALTTVFMIELRQFIKKHHLTKGLHGHYQILITLVISILVVLSVMILCRILFGYGDGLLALAGKV